MNAGELFIQLAFKGDTSQAEAFKSKIKEVANEMNATVRVANKTNAGTNDLIKSFVRAAVAIKGVAIAYANLVSTLDNNQVWINLTRQTDLALNSLQGYAAVANVMDKSFGMESAAQSIASLEQRLYEMQITGRGGEGFLMSGIMPYGKNATQVLEDVRNRIKGLSNTQATFLLNKMGIDPRMLGMLRMTREEFASLNKELSKYQLTDKQRKAIQKYQEQISIATKKIQYFKEKLVFALMPTFVKLAESLARVVEGISKAVDWYKKFWDGMSDGQKALVKISAALAALGLVLIGFLSHPAIAAFTAALIAIYLIIDDIMVYLEGGESVLGDILKWADEFVHDENSPKWLRDLVYVLTNAEKLKSLLGFKKPPTQPEDILNTKNIPKDKLAELQENFKEINKEENNTKERLKTASLTRNSIVESNLGNLFSLAGAVGAIPGNIMGLLSGLGFAKSVSNAVQSVTINQNNNITTSETGDAALQGLKHAQTVATYGLGN